MQFQQIDTQSIDALMDVFYAKVRNDKTGLGDIFNTRIGTGEEEWSAHKKKIANFWQGMLLQSGDYNGQPMKAHLDLPPFPREFFNTWLGLFSESLALVFAREEDRANVYMRAQMIAQRFQFMLYESGH